MQPSRDMENRNASGTIIEKTIGLKEGTSRIELEELKNHHNKSRRDFRKEERGREQYYRSLSRRDFGKEERVTK